MLTAEIPALPTVDAPSSGAKIDLFSTQLQVAAQCPYNPNCAGLLALACFRDQGTRIGAALLLGPGVVWNWGPLIAVERVGKDGVPFALFKIRTMDQSRTSTPELAQLLIDNEGYKFQKDPRITPIGRILRKYGLDELPQLANLLMGDIKLIGLRPKASSEFSVLPIAEQEARKRVKPGLFSVEYGFKQLDNSPARFESEMRYLREYAVAPMRTDIKYAVRALWCIVANGRRGI